MPSTTAKRTGAVLILRSSSTAGAARRSKKIKLKLKLFQVLNINSDPGGRWRQAGWGGGHSSSLAIPAHEARIRSSTPKSPAANQGKTRKTGKAARERTSSRSGCVSKNQQPVLDKHPHTRGLTGREAQPHRRLAFCMTGATSQSHSFAGLAPARPRRSARDAADAAAACAAAAAAAAAAVVAAMAPPPLRAVTRTNESIDIDFGICR